MSLNPVLLQKALRDNSNDLQDFCKDLQNWGEDMKRKEAALNETSNEACKNKNKKIPKTEKKVTFVESSKTPISRAASTDYAAWDKFDVDAELNKLEEDSPDDSDLTDECNDDKYDEAIVEKEKGNKFVKNQKWNEAIKCYTNAVKCYAYDPIFYANRALCYLKLNKFEEAEKDCNLSLKLDANYVKAYQRRAAARSSLNKLEFAESDLLKVVELEPKNKESLAELNKLRQKLNKKPPEQRPISKFTASRNLQSTTNKTSISQKEPTLKTENVNNEPISIWTPINDIIEVKPIQKAPHFRSTKPLKRIRIKEEDIDLNEKSNAEPITKHVIEKQEEKMIEEIGRPMIPVKQLDIEKSLEETVNTSLPRPDNKNFHIKTDDLKVIERKEVSIPKEIKNTVNDNKKSAKKSFVSPKNSVQFYSTWKDLRNSYDKYLYLKSISPMDLPKIFMTALDSNTFSTILNVICQHYLENKDCVFDVLEKFSQVNRFGAITMFLSSEDKKNLWTLFDHIKENEGKNNDQVDELIRKYEM